VEFLSIGGGKLIGANSHYLCIDDIHVLLDTGIHPREEGYASLPSFDLLGDRSMDALFISHCHHDHLGALPLSIRNHPHARVFMTYASSYLYAIMLHNTVTVMNLLREEKGIREYPLFTHDDVDVIDYVVQGMKFNRSFPVYGHEQKVHALECRWLPAGHTLGAGGLLLKGREGTVFYTGDTCTRSQFLIRGAKYPDERVDVLLMECTLGGRDETARRKSEVDRLARIISDTSDRGGSVLIPAFALGKTQEMLWLVHRLKTRRQIPPVDVYVTGLGRMITRMYDLTVEWGHRVDEDFLFENVEYAVMDTRKLEERGLWLKRPSVIIASSGMMMENTPSYVLARRMIPEERHTICFVGYISPDSPSGVLSESQLGDPVGIYGEPLTRLCRIEKLAFSGHSSREDLAQLVRNLRPLKVILLHGGSEQALEWMTNKIHQIDYRMDVLSPSVGNCIRF
jgi:Cft2 family RNA processing exonuclease